MSRPPPTSEAWPRVGQLAPDALAEQRAVLHWAAQLVAAAADAALARPSDDSHTNMRWGHELGALVGRDLGGVAVALELEPPAIALLGDGAAVGRLPLAGRTLDDALDWLASELPARLARPVPRPVPREYDMPLAPVATGAPFPRDGAAERAELARWFRLGFAATAEVIADRPGATEVACWPHHFDVGAIAFLDPGQRDGAAAQIGVGLSPGDHHIGEPYAYVTPWPLPVGTRLPALPAGRWRTLGFTGAVLPGHEIVAAGAGQRERVLDFLRAAMAAGDAHIVR